MPSFIQCKQQANYPQQIPTITQLSWAIFGLVTYSVFEVHLDHLIMSVILTAMYNTTYTSLRRALFISCGHTNTNKQQSVVILIMLSATWIPLWLLMWHPLLQSIAHIPVVQSPALISLLDACTFWNPTDIIYQSRRRCLLTKGPYQKF